MSEQSLKPGWTWVKFGDVVRLNTDRCADPVAAGIERYVGLEHIEPEDLRIRRWGLVAEGTTFTNCFQPGQVLFGKRRAYQRKVAVADFEGICSGDIYVFEPKNERLLPELLPFLCQTERFFEYAVGTSAGSLSPRTNWTQLANYEFALPPLEEQRRIVDLLESTVKLSELLQETLECHRNVTESLFVELINEDSSSKVVALAELCEFITDGDHNPPKRQAQGVPHLVVNNIGDRRISENGCTFISQEDYERVSKRYLPTGGDIIITCVGTVGRIALVPDDYLFSADRSLAICRPKRQALLPDYAAWLLSSRDVQNEFRHLSRGTAQLHLYLGDLRKVKVKLPNIIAQERHLNQLRKVDSTQYAIQERLKEVKKLRQTIIHQELGCFKQIYV